MASWPLRSSDSMAMREYVLWGVDPGCSCFGLQPEQRAAREEGRTSVKQSTGVGRTFPDFGMMMARARGCVLLLCDVMLLLRASSACFFWYDDFGMYDVCLANLIEGWGAHLLFWKHHACLLLLLSSSLVFLSLMFLFFG